MRWFENNLKETGEKSEWKWRKNGENNGEKMEKILNVGENKMFENSSETISLWT